MRLRHAILIYLCGIALLTSLGVLVRYTVGMSLLQTFWMNFAIGMLWAWMVLSMYEDATP